MKIKGLDSREINYIITKKQKCDEDSASFQSLPKTKMACPSQDSFAYNESLQHPTSFHGLHLEVMSGTMTHLLAHTRKKGTLHVTCTFRVSWLKQGHIPSLHGRGGRFES